MPWFLFFSRAPDTVDPWDSLTECFNDPDLSYQNVCMRYNEQGQKTYDMLPGLQPIACKCKDIDPSGFHRPTRDTTWFKTQFRDIKTVNHV